MPALIQLAILAAALAQQAEPPPQPRTERIRPVPRVPRDDSFFNTGPLLWKGAELRAGWMQGKGLELNTQDGRETLSQGINNPMVVTIRYEEMDVEAAQIGATFDLGLFRFSFDGFMGSWEGDATLTVDDGLNPNTVTASAIAVDGDFWGVKGGVFWPAFRVRVGALEAALGPSFTVAWYHQDLESVPGSPLPFGDRVNEIVGGLGPRLSVRYFAQGFDVALEAEVPILFGAARGWGTEFSAGFGLRF